MLFLTLTDSKGKSCIINMETVSYICEGDKFSFVHMNTGKVAYVTEPVSAIAAMIDGD